MAWTKRLCLLSALLLCSNVLIADTASSVRKAAGLTSVETPSDGIAPVAAKPMPVQVKHEKENAQLRKVDRRRLRWGPISKESASHAAFLVGESSSAANRLGERRPAGEPIMLSTTETDPLMCAPGSVFGQTAHGPDDLWVAPTSDENAVLEHFESYRTVYDSNVCSVKYVGFNRMFSGTAWAECSRTQDNYNVVFYPDDGTGQPDVANPACTYLDVTPIKTLTSINYSGRTLYEYELDLSTLPGGCCSLTSGWVSVQGVDDGTGCWFLWLSSPDGDEKSYFDAGSGLAPEAEDLNICLGGDLEPGACCNNITGDCVDTPPMEWSDCDTNGARFAPGGTCADFVPACGIAFGACCAEDGCLETDPDACAALGGSFLGDGTSCDPYPCPLPGDTCENPVVIDFASELPFVDENTTCGHGDDYQNTCLDLYDLGEDFIYEFVVTEEMCVNIELTTDSGAYVGLAIDNVCPLDSGLGDCLYKATSNTQWQLRNVALSPGTYYLMIDTFAPPACTPYTLTIEECPVGACCTGDACTVLGEDECAALAGVFVGDGTDCSNAPCSTGACCDAGACTVTTAENCAGIYAGGGTACTPDVCDECPCTAAIATPYCEDFESGTLGDWSQSADDEMDFFLTNWNTPSSGTGPNGDHTTGSGYFLFTEASNNHNRTAIIDGPCIDLSDDVDPRVEFWYHMYGADTGSLALEVSATDCITWDRVWSLSGDQGNAWKAAAVDLVGYGGQTIHIRFVAKTGPGNLSDIALDDFCIFDSSNVTGACCYGATCADDVSEAECVSGGGSYLGNFSICTDPNPCAGACCYYPDGMCLLESEAECGGLFLGGATTCDEGCPAAGDICEVPLVIDVSDELPYVAAHSTCGHANDYQDTCLNSYDSGEDVIYELVVDEPTCVNVELTTQTGSYIGLAIDDSCLFGGNGDACLSTVTSSSGPWVLEGVELAAGENYLMIDTWAPPQCTDYTLSIEPCAVGACCVDNVCQMVSEGSCAAQGGLFFGVDTTCDGDPCSSGACCYPEGSCVEETADTCGGDFHGYGTTCDPYPCPPMNDMCVDAVPLSGEVIELPFDTTFASYDGTGTCQIAPNVWYTYTADCYGDLLISLCGSDYDTKLAVYDGTDCGNFTELACNDDSCDVQSEVTIAVVPGQTLLIEVGGYTYDGVHRVGPGVLTVRCEEPFGACCDPVGGCTAAYEAECVDLGGSFAGPGSVCGGDCNSDGVNDVCEILLGADDCNRNRVPDTCDIDSGASTDLDQNGMPDECDPDCNTNGIPDVLDIILGTSEDCQPDDIPDECQLGGGTVFGGDKAATDYAYGVSASVNLAASFQLQTPDVFVTTGAVTTPTGRTLVAGDFGPENTYEFMYVLESGAPHNLYKMDVATGALTLVGPAVPNGGEHWAGMAWDGSAMYANAVENNVSSGLYEVELATGAVTFIGPMTGSPLPVALAADCAGTLYSVDIVNDDLGTVDKGTGAYTSLGPLGFNSNYAQGLDYDAEAGELYFTAVRSVSELEYYFELRRFNQPFDGSSTVVGIMEDEFAFLGIASGECGAGADCNNNQIPDECDIASGFSEDLDLNGIPDECEDCNGNGVSDDIDIAQGTSQDCNLNDRPDECDVADGAADCQGDLIPDECQLGITRLFEVGDGGFEAGTPNPYWTEASSNFGTPLCDPENCGVGAHSGAWWTWFGGFLNGGVEIGSVEQAIAIPLGSPSLEFYIRIQASSGNGTDFVRLLVDGNTEWEIFEDTAGYESYARVQIDLSAYADNKQHTIRFESMTNTPVDVETNFFLDDVVLDGPSVVPTNDCNANGIPDDCELCGDLDGDGDVDYDDYLLFLNAFGRSLGEADYMPCADYDDTFTVGLGDYTVWLTCYRDHIDNPKAGPPSARRFQTEGNDLRGTDVGQDLTPGVRPSGLNAR